MREDIYYEEYDMGHLSRKISERIYYMIWACVSFGENLRKYWFSLDAVKVDGNSMIGYFNFYLEGRWAKAILGQEAALTYISLKSRMFGYFCSWDSVPDFVLRCDCRVFFCLDPSCSHSGLV